MARALHDDIEIDLMPPCPQRSQVGRVQRRIHYAILSQYHWILTTLQSFVIRLNMMDSRQQQWEQQLEQTGSCCHHHRADEDGNQNVALRLDCSFFSYYYVVLCFGNRVII